MRFFLLIIFLMFFKPSFGQFNLVPNPSFEDTVYCPYGGDQIDAAQGWSTFGNSPDYFNGCNQLGLNVPNTDFGFQQAHSGNAFAGIATYCKNNSPQGNNYREYIGVELNSPLQVGVKYYISFYAVLAEKNTGFASNNLGLRFFTNLYSLSNPAPLDNFSNLKFDSLLTDSINWHIVSGSFIADSNYHYICIGNFYDFMNTDTIYTGVISQAAYYFVDDICVSTDSIYNETWTGLYVLDPNEVDFWPNPVQNYFHYRSNQNIEEIIIYDDKGKLIKKEKVNAMEGSINLDMIAKGIYLAYIKKEKTISVYKFLKL